MSLGKDYSHLLGRRIIDVTENGRGYKLYTILECAVCEYSMGITLKPVASSNTGNNPNFGTTCLNGKSSPNKEDYEYFADVYDDLFKYLITRLENYEILDNEVFGAIANKPYHGGGNLHCASGMPV